MGVQIKAMREAQQQVDRPCMLKPSCL